MEDTMEEMLQWFCGKGMPQRGSHDVKKTLAGQTRCGGKTTVHSECGKRYVASGISEG